MTSTILEMQGFTSGAAMQIDWMNWNELTESIPPAYSEFIGKQAIQFIEAQRVVI